MKRSTPDVPEQRHSSSATSSPPLLRRLLRALVGLLSESTVRFDAARSNAPDRGAAPFALSALPPYQRDCCPPSREFIGDRPAASETDRDGGSRAAVVDDTPMPPAITGRPSIVKPPAIAVPLSIATRQPIAPSTASPTKGEDLRQAHRARRDILRG
jgi:hypothetical protein